MEITDLQIKPKEYSPKIDGQFMGKRSKSDTLTVDEALNLV